MITHLWARFCALRRPWLLEDWDPVGALVAYVPPRDVLCLAKIH